MLLIVHMKVNCWEADDISQSSLKTFAAETKANQSQAIKSKGSQKFRS